MFAIVTAGSAHEFVIVVPEVEGLLHLKVCEPPVTVLVVEILIAVLQEDSDIAFLAFADEGRIDVTAPDVGEAANVADDVFEKVGAFPGHGEGADSSGAHTTDGPAGGIGGEFDRFADFGEDFSFKKHSVFGREGVIFDGAVAAFLTAPILLALDLSGEEPGINEDSDGEGRFALGVQVVEDGGGPDQPFFVDISMTILKDDDVGILRAIVLGGHVKVILAEGSFEDLTLPFVAGDLALWGIGLGKGVGGELVVFGRERCEEEEGGEESFQHGRIHSENLVNVKVM